MAGWDNYLGEHRAAFDELLRAAAAARHRARGCIEVCDRLTDGGRVGRSPGGRDPRIPADDARQGARRAPARARPSARRLAGHDLSLADSLAGRAASALDNCLLYEEIQRADQRKNEFLATLSHELRNPLAPMRAALHMLRAAARGCGEAPRSLLETMDRQVGR